MSEIDTSSPGWPDPKDWLDRLESSSREHAQNYLRATAQRNREPESYTENEVQIETACTLLAHRVLSSITNSLYELPIFKDHPAMTVLSDLNIALYDVAAGGAPSLLRRGEGRNDLSPIGQDVVIGYVALSVRLLKEALGFTDVAARQKVAEIMAKRGLRGRKGRGLSASTLQDWQDSYSKLPAGHPVHDAIERQWNEWTSHPDWQGRNLSGALEWIETLADRPEFRNKRQ